MVFFNQKHLFFFCLCSLVSIHELYELGGGVNSIFWKYFVVYILHPCLKKKKKTTKTKKYPVFHNTGPLFDVGDLVYEEKECSPACAFQCSVRMTSHSTVER